LAYKYGYLGALLGLGEVLDDMGDHAGAVTTYNKFLAIGAQDRELALAHLKKSVALANSGRHQDALEECKEALKYAPRDVGVLIQKARELAETEGTEAGIAALKTVLNENKTSESAPFASFYLGILLKNKGDRRAAIAQFQKAVSRQPNYVEAHQELANALVQQNDLAGARAEFEALVKLSDSDLQRHNYKLFAYQWLGNALRDVPNLPAAARAYRDALLLKPDFPAAHCELGSVLAKLGRSREAIDEYGAALVPARAKEFDDPACTKQAPNQIVAMLASLGQEGAATRIREIQKSRQASNSTQGSEVSNNLLLAAEKRTANE